MQVLRVLESGALNQEYWFMECLSGNVMTFLMLNGLFYGILYCSLKKKCILVKSWDFIFISRVGLFWEICIQTLFLDMLSFTKGSRMFFLKRVFFRVCFSLAFCKTLIANQDYLQLKMFSIWWLNRQRNIQMRYYRNVHLNSI